MSMNMNTWEDVSAVYSAVYSSILSFLTIQYIFRTCLVMNPNLAGYFKGWRCVFWLGYVFVFGFAWGFITYFYAYPDQYARDYVRMEMYQQYRVDSNDIPLFVLLAYGEKNETKFVRFQSLICIFGDMGIMTLQYVIMMTCGVLLYKKITSDLRYAEAMIAYSQIHKQFFKALVYQVNKIHSLFSSGSIIHFQLAAPSLLVHLPAVPLFFAPFFDMKISFRTRIVVYFFSIYPLLDSIILVSVISDYKLAVQSNYYSFFYFISISIPEIIVNRAVRVLSLLNNTSSVGPSTQSTALNNRVAESVL
uniref:Seven TM Receptor n=1 Tax=Caenorhabditis tropicalis TaxID=1561998 RepID=A0A1I7U858_9PELO